MRIALSLIVILLSVSIYAQDDNKSSFLKLNNLSVKTLPYFYAADVQGYNFSGTIIGIEYSLIENRVINKFLDAEIGYSKLTEDNEISSAPNGYMLSFKYGYKFITDYNFFSSVRIRVSYSENHLRNSGIGEINSWKKEDILSMGPEIILGKRFNLFNNLFIDLGLGATYNYSWKDYKSYTWIKYWPKVDLQIGYRFKKLKS